MKQSYLKSFCAFHRISMSDLAEITNVSIPQLYYIDRNPGLRITIETIDRIRQSTEKKFGKAIEPWQYLSHPMWKAIYRKYVISRPVET